MPARNSKGQFVKRAARRVASGARSVARRGASVARRAGGRFRAAMPRFNGTRVAKVTGALTAGTAIRRYMDIPYVSEEGIGILALAIVERDQTVKNVLGDVALGLQAKEIMDRTGATDTLLGFLPAGPQKALPPGTPVTDADGNVVGVVA